MKKVLVLLLSLCAAPAFADMKADQTPINTGTLFSQMADLDHLASFPDPPYRMLQYSSYDRRSNLPAGPEWFANNDGFGGEPLPSFEKVLKAPGRDGVGEYIIADTKGPGAIVRLWSAWINGTIRLYIDDMDHPVYEGDANEFFHHTFSKYAGMKSINADRFRQTVYQQDASYTPIPFAKGMRMVWTGKIADLHFYQVQVRLYPESANVVSFQPADIETYSREIDRATLALSDPDKYTLEKPDATVQGFKAEIQPNQKKEVLHAEGEKAIQRLEIKLQAENLDKALRQTVLSIVCDGYPWGQVQSPVGDFFGAALGINPYESLPFEVKPDGTMISRFVMPFSKSVSIQLENHGDQDVSVEGSAKIRKFMWTDRTMYFRAKWRISRNITASGTAVFDLPFLIAHGKGVYVGTTAYLMNPCEVPTSWGNWWGEGDEKVFVDNGSMPSLFGTGSEDYFNYSWSIPDIFYHPYCGQPRNDGPGNRGFVTNFRWHILDPIPFLQDLLFYIELNSHEKTPGLSYARIGYHYARPGMMDDIVPIMPEDLQYLKPPDNWEPEAKKGSANSIFYATEKLVKDPSDTRMRSGRMWEGSKLFIWTPKKVNDRKDFNLPVKSSGEQRIYLTAALTPNSGKFTVAVDGKKAMFSNETDTADLYRPYRNLLRNFSLKPLKLDQGSHTLTVIYAGANGAVQHPEIGIDFIWVQSTGNRGG